MPNFPVLSNEEAFILSYLLQNKKGYGQTIVNASEGLLQRDTVHITLNQMTDKGYLWSWEEDDKEGQIKSPKKVYEAADKGASVFNEWRRMVMKFALQPAKEAKK